MHADLANRAVRNEFRNRFQLDCIYFRPDEECANYVDTASDWWMAVTHWDPAHNVGTGFSRDVAMLKWCVVGPDSFSERKDRRGFDASIHKTLSVSQSYVSGHYSSLESDLRSACLSPDRQVVVCDFS